MRPLKRMIRLGRVLLALSLLQSAFGADSISLFNQLGKTQPESAQSETVKKIRAQSRVPYKSLEDALAHQMHQQFALDNDSTLIATANIKHDIQRSVHFQQFYKGVPVYQHESVLLLAENDDILQAYGKVATNIQLILKNDFATYKTKDYTQLIDDTIAALFSNESRLFRSLEHELVIFVRDGKSQLALSISFFTDLRQGLSQPQRVQLLVDIDTGEVLQQKQVLTHHNVGGAGPSGNAKVTRTDYQSDRAEQTPPATFILDKKTTNNASVCFFDALNVKTFDAQSSTENFPESPFSFDCTASTYNDYKLANTAKSPINDAHYHAQVAARMFEDYLGEAPYVDLPIVQYVHYGNNFDNAFYEEGKIFYGDGNFLFYPLVSLDTVTHEIAHGYTAGYGYSVKKLMNSGEAYAINEAFSDMSGEAAKFFLTGENNWQNGYEIWQSAGPVRYFDWPSKDGNSVDHVDLYYSDLDPHYGAGIFNKAFYHLASQNYEDSTLPWNTKLAFIIFAKANRACWLANSTFIEAADCVMRRSDYALSLFKSEDPNNPNSNSWNEFSIRNDIRKAFSQVGIVLDAYESGDGNALESKFSANAKLLEISLTNNSRFNGQALTEGMSDDGWQWQWWVDNQLVSQNFNAQYTATEPGQHKVRLIITDPDGRKDQITHEINLVEDYCPVDVKKSEKYYFRNVGINGSHNKTGANGYGDYSATVTTLKKDQPLKLSLSIARNKYTRGLNWVEVWIDKDRDGIFEKATDRLYGNTIRLDEVIDTGFVGEINQNYRLRLLVSLSYRHDICGSISDAEVEDYTLRWTENTEDQSDVTYVHDTNSIQFITTSNLTNIAQWQWDFGDGSDVHIGDNPSVKYAKTGEYNITARALAEDNKVLYEWQNTVQFESQTQPEFSQTINGKTLTVKAEDSIYPKDSTLQWSFGDGNSATGNTANHTYAQVGEYTVTLSIINDDNPSGISTSKKALIGDSDFSPAFYTDTLRHNTNGWLVKFFDTTDKPSDAKTSDRFIHWDFGDGESEESSYKGSYHGPTHRYSADGQYLITMTYRYKQSTGTGDDDWQWREKSETVELTLNANSASTYCQPEFDTTYEYIDTLSINNKDFNNGNAGGLVNENQPLRLNIDRNRFRIEAGYKDPNEKSPELYSIWIDLNRDGLFGGENWDQNSPERLIHQLDMDTPPNGNGYLDGVFSLPINSLQPGVFQSRMRIMQNYSLTGQESSYPCINNKYYSPLFGEVEDYIVTWQLAPEVMIQPSITTNAIQLTNATENDDAILWTWQINEEDPVETRELGEYLIKASGQYLVTVIAKGLDGTELSRWSERFDMTTTTQAAIEVSVDKKTLTYNINDSVYPEDTAISISFGDGDVSKSKSGHHKYKKPGDYQITLTLTNVDNPDGITKTAKVTIEGSSGGALGIFEIAMTLLLLTVGFRRLSH